MMPYLRSVLRDALGRSGKDVRLGNIRCVSARQAWWTKELKEEIWQRGGAGWMVGKVNVGKSRLFHDIFPKGRSEKVASLSKKIAKPITVNLENRFDTRRSPVKVTSNRTEQVEVSEDLTRAEELASSEMAEEFPETEALTTSETSEEDYKLSDTLNTSSLLPPAPPETDYPAMPLVSSLPGTTASPIRLTFGNGRGELIDLPGLCRGNLEHHVQQQFRPDLVMKTRIVPKQQVIKPGQSIILGGFIRITPVTPDVIVMAYAFTPILSHLTATEKAIGTQMHTRASNVVNISLPETTEKIASAGTFHLKWDVTRERTGPITAREAVNIKPERLPYRVLATDILIEGCGWVELVAQVRKKPGEMGPVNEIRAGIQGERPDQNEEWESAPMGEVEEIDPGWPAVEVFSPEGRFIASRRPMNAWLHIANGPNKGKLQGRPRKSMKGAKKAEKRRKAVA
jgi:genetic interactor of prohibitins 3, mitochondrial